MPVESPKERTAGRRHERDARADAAYEPSQIASPTTAAARIRRGGRPLSTQYRACRRKSDEMERIMNGWRRICCRPVRCGSDGDYRLDNIDPDEPEPPCSRCSDWETPRSAIDPPDSPHALQWICRLRIGRRPRVRGRDRNEAIGMHSRSPIYRGKCGTGLVHAVYGSTSA